MSYLPWPVCQPPPGATSWPPGLASSLWGLGLAGNTPQALQGCYRLGFLGVTSSLSPAPEVYIP